MCVLGGDWRFADEKQQNGKSKAPAPKPEEEISEGVKEVVRKCLRDEPVERPDVDDLISMLENLIAYLPEDEGEE